MTWPITRRLIMLREPTRRGMCGTRRWGNGAPQTEHSAEDEANDTVGIFSKANLNDKTRS